MPAISSSTPDLSGFPPWQYSGANLVVGGPLTPQTVATVIGTLPIGAVLGVVSASGAYTLCDPNVSPPDGSQAPAAILANPGSAGPPTVSPAVYLVGQFNTECLFYSANWSVSALIAALKQAGILARTPRSGII